MKKIKLSQNKYALVDDADFEFLNRWKWYAVKRPNNFYAVRNRSRTLGRGQIYMHRVILRVRMVDHVNGDGLDNRRKNLRGCNHSQNACNQREALGVRRMLWGNSPWQARVKHLGYEYVRYFRTKQAAIVGRWALKQELHGEFCPK